MIKDKIYALVVDDKKINVKKIALIIATIILVIELIMIAINSLEIIKQHKVYQQYEAQIMALAKQEEDKQVEIERKKQEKIPKLTRRRKK